MDWRCWFAKVVTQVSWVIALEYHICSSNHDTRATNFILLLMEVKARTETQANFKVVSYRVPRPRLDDLSSLLRHHTAWVRQSPDSTKPRCCSDVIRPQNMIRLVEFGTICTGTEPLGLRRFADNDIPRANSTRTASYNPRCIFGKQIYRWTAKDDRTPSWSSIVDKAQFLPAKPEARLYGVDPGLLEEGRS